MFLCMCVCVCARFSLAVSELLYALQWCKEVGDIAAFHSLLTDSGLLGLQSQVPMKDLLETLYSR